MTKEKKKKVFQLVKGMKDILPEDEKYWSAVWEVVENLALKYGFGRIETPVLEMADLFARGTGSTTDIVEKEMYSFVDQAGEKLALRPEGTPGAVRSYIEHGLINLPQPVKLFYFCSMFRHDKPQAGRYRQFSQVGFEVIGDPEPVIDAQLINLAYQIYTSFQLQPSVQVNSIGCLECRPAYEQALKEHFKKDRNKLSEISRERLSKNVMRILDSKEEEDQPSIAKAPQQMDFLCEACQKHFMQVLEYLDDLQVPYFLNSRIVRGLDYYTRTTYELWLGEEEAGRQSSLGGGGRYDGLVELLGGRPTPASGFAIGVERLILQLKEHDLKGKERRKPEVFVAQLGNEARRKALGLYEELFKAGVLPVESFSKSGLKPQLEIADRLKVPYTVILGQKEIIDGTVLLREMSGGIQEVVPFNKIVPEVLRRLGKAEIVYNEKSETR
ncbi:MAG: histidine--tRNA ligase [Candidatus Komeilibacteria bacterium]|nr:histidine--tRNA ligase [Candidatus Komeilibacteria bacterium]